MDSEVLVTKMTQEQLNKILQQHKLWLDTKGEEGKRANLMGADLRYTNLRNANLIGADLRFANLRGANLVHADLRDANLEVADLEGVDLTGVDLSGADLRGADLRGTNLTGANLEGTNLTDADLEDTGVYFFIGPKHKAVYNSKDDKLFIGCQVHSLEHWLKNYVAIGKEHGYTDKEIEEYGNWIKSLKELKSVRKP